MNEASGQETKLALSASSKGAVMSSKERSGYWAKLNPRVYSSNHHAGDEYLLCSQIQSYKST